MTVVEGRLEKRNGEQPEVKAWRAEPDPKADLFFSSVAEPEVKIKWYQEILSTLVVQWTENKVGLGLAAAFVAVILWLILG